MTSFHTADATRTRTGIETQDLPTGKKTKKDATRTRTGIETAVFIFLSFDVLMQLVRARGLKPLVRLRSAYHKNDATRTRTGIETR